MIEQAAYYQPRARVLLWRKAGTLVDMCNVISIPKKELCTHTGTHSNQLRLFQGSSSLLHDGKAITGEHPFPRLLRLLDSSVDLAGRNMPRRWSLLAYARRGDLALHS